MNLLRPCILKSLSGQLARKPRRYAFFHSSPSLSVLKPYILADIGEGIKEVQIIQWFVEPEARVEQFDKICEVQSDKAAVDITSRFDGVIKKLHYQADDMVQVGKALCDIDVQSDISPEDEALLTPPAEQVGSPDEVQQPRKAAAKHEEQKQEAPPEEEQEQRNSRATQPSSSSKHAGLATPAVRGLLKELDIDIFQVSGTGKDGRVLKDDVHKYAASRTSPTKSPHLPSTPSEQVEEPVRLTHIQTQMFKTMTRSLSIPHFLYADEIDITALAALRRRLNAPSPSPFNPPAQKLSYLPFIIKAVSIALLDFPLLNARLDTSDEKAPKLIMRQVHNIGIAMDTPQGLLVPNIKDVQSNSIHSIAAEIGRLQHLARSASLTAKDLAGGTVTVSNIGSIGGTYVTPIIASQNEVAILGVGKVRGVPAFGAGGEVVRREVCCFSWSADHRVVDGATVARMGERVRGLVEEPERMVVGLR